MEADNLLYAVACSDSNTAWAVGAVGTIAIDETLNNIFATFNGGSTWDSKTSGSVQYLNGCFFTDENNGWAIGERGTILHTTDGT